MALNHIILRGGAGILLLAGVISLRAADPLPPRDQPPAIEKRQPEAVPPPRPPTREESDRLREDWDRMSPEEREVRKREYFQKTGKPMFSRKEFEKRCEEFEKFSPEEQRAKIMEWRDQELALRERFQKHLAELRLKQKDGTLDEEDSKRLERMEVLAKRFEKTRPPRHGPPHNGRPREGRDPVRPQDGPRAP